MLTNQVFGAGLVLLAGRTCGFPASRYPLVFLDPALVIAIRGGIHGQCA